jgi:hypothetical protein
MCVAPQVTSARARFLSTLQIEQEGKHIVKNIHICVLVLSSWSLFLVPWHDSVCSTNNCYVIHKVRICPVHPTSWSDLHHSGFQNTIQWFVRACYGPFALHSWFDQLIIYGEVCKLESQSVAYPGIFFRVAGSQIQLRTEGRENGDLRAVAP